MSPGIVIVISCASGVAAATVTAVTGITAWDTRMTGTPAVFRVTWVMSSAAMGRGGLGDAKVTVPFATFEVVQVTTYSSLAAGRICGAAGLATKTGGPEPWVLPLLFPQFHLLCVFHSTHVDIQICGSNSPASSCVEQRNLC